jgi:hypothetical protein
MAIARNTQHLDRHRDEISDAARTARSFAAKHAFEITFEARTRHLICLSRLPDDLKRELRA